jgi:hypothetical protein
MAGLVPAIHAGTFNASARLRRMASNERWHCETDAHRHGVDARDKPGQADLWLNWRRRGYNIV